MIEEERQRTHYLIGSYLDAGKLMQLATRSPAGLWMCNVWYASTKDLKRIVFASNQARRHSEEIRRDGTVAGSVIAIELEGLGQKVQGLTFAGVAVEAQGAVAEAAYEVYASKWPQVRVMFTADDLASGRTPMRMYVVTPQRFVLWDEVHFPNAPRQELLMSW